ncbi:MAG: ParA family protein [Gammaproteobacteria bacterium]|nr:ParA family protein [Gammaproteobacteria bacterium]
MQKIVVLNTKGGCGKTTIATNLAARFAMSDYQTTLMDQDSQGSSMRWLSKRSEDLPFVNGIAAYQRNLGVTRSWQLRVPTQTERLVIDTPAALDPQGLTEVTRNAHAVIIPVMPSDIDIHAASRCISDLLLIAKLDRREDRIAVVANRARQRTRMFRSLEKFLTSLHIPFVTAFRDTQNYVRCSEKGIGIYELADARADADREDWDKLMEWIAQRPPSAAQVINGPRVVRSTL